jgi:predicted kinase
LLAIVVGFNMSGLMSKAAELTIILGSPASGKTTLARRLGLELSLPVLCKDDVKEALFDTLGVADRGWSRRLSEASFKALALLARTQLALGQSCIVEGNWRALHARALERALTESGARCAQIWCGAEPQEIVRRFTSRTRHEGHLDPLLSLAEIESAAHQPPAFLELAGPRWVYRSDSPEAFAELANGLKSWRL